jgi:hypothetical protein
MRRQTQAKTEKRAIQGSKTAREAIGFIGLGVQTTKGAEKAGEQGDAKKPLSYNWE